MYWVTHKFEFKESSVFFALISMGLEVTKIIIIIINTLCPDISYQIPENSTINEEIMNINSFSPLSAVWFSMVVIL
jgi:hypothetical protein